MASETEEAQGFKDGQAAGSWVIDGNTPEVAIVRLVQGIEDGDPEVLDALPQAPAGASEDYAADALGLAS